MIFVDTGAWFASVVPSDRDHAAATRWLSQNTQPLLTTDYIIDETLTFLKTRGQTLRAMAMGEQFFRGTLATTYYLTEADILLGWQTFRQFSARDMAPRPLILWLALITFTPSSQERRTQSAQRLPGRPVRCVPPAIVTLYALI